MKKEKHFIDLSKLSEEQQRPLSVLVKFKISMVKQYPYLTIVLGKWNQVTKVHTITKTELTYPNFIKLFEGGEPIKSDQTLIEKLEAEKKELVEALEKVEKWGGEFGMDYQIYKEIKSLIQKMNQSPTQKI